MAEFGICALAPGRCQNSEARRLRYKGDPLSSS
jgi:hypothetical protein